MTITIGPEQEALIAEAIGTRAYRDPAEVIGRALELLRSEEQWLEGDKAAVRDKIDRAMAQFERGQFFSPEQSRADMERRKAVWSRDRQS